MKMSTIAKWGLLTLGAMAVVGMARPAEATPIISVTPTPITVQSGLSQNFVVAVTNLGTDEVGGVSLQLSWNGALLAPGTVTIDPQAKMGTALDAVNNVDPANGFSGGNKLTLSFLADISLDAAALHALQGNGFQLATFSLTGAGIGVTPVNLNVFSPAGPNGVALSDGDGNSLPATLNGACVTVAESNTQPPQACGQAVVPEPASIALMGTGLGFAMMAVRRRRAQSNG